MAVKVDESKCTGCGICVQVCPVDAITVDQVAEIDAATCIDCGSCIAECPSAAISMDRMEAAASSRNSPSLPLSQISTMRDVTLPVAPRSSMVQPGFQQLNGGGILEQISDFFGRFANQGCGHGYGRGKSRGGCRGRGKSRWR
ncbi:MAG: 4Fe-4S binding protein [Syntrophaceae bacterium]